MKTKSVVLGVVSSAALLFPPCLLAQGGALEEVIVTAQKTEESIQDVPISMSAYSVRSLEQAGIRSTDELSVITPGLQTGRVIGSATPFIRGVGTQNTSAGDESGVATYVDGVYYASQVAGVQSFNNLQRVEVLKGPQGTLFGRNATGGLIHYITRDPQQEADLQFRVGYGNYETSTVNLYATSGITDLLAADLAIYHEEQADGYGRNLTSGRDANEARTSAARSKWLLTAGDNTTATLALDYSDSRTSVGATFAQAPGTLGFGGTAYTGDWWDSQGDYEPLVTSRAWGGSLTVDHDFSDINLVSITAYRDYDELQAVDQDGTAIQVVDATLNQYTKSFSQELRFGSDASDRLRWITGLFYFQAEAGYDPLDISGLGMLGATQGLAGTRQVEVQQDTRSIAAFGQATWSLSDDLRLTLGLRYTHDKREIEADEFLYTGFDATGTQIPLGRTDADESWGKITWRASLDYNVSPTTLLYTTLSRGFKAGVYNSILPGDPPVDPETLDAIEIGLKSDFLASTLRWNSALFYYEYDDLQIQRLDGGVAQLLNAAKVVSYGLDTSLDFAVSRHLTLVTSLSLLKAEFDEFPDAPITTPSNLPPAFANTVSPGDASGNDMLRSPRWTANVGAIYSANGSFGGIDASLFYYYNDGFAWDADNRLQQPDYETLNANLGWHLPGGHWELSLYGRNLSNEKYSYYATGGQLGDLYTAAPPRTWGVAVRYQLR